MNDLRDTGFLVEMHFADNGSQGSLIDILVVPAGEVESVNGNFFFTAEDAALMIAEFERLHRDIAIDYEHQSLGGVHSSPDGKSPAAGWITQLSFDPKRGLVAKVKWTDKARAFIRSKEYRYLSPVVKVDKKTIHAVELVNAALTNDPAIVGGLPVAAKDKRKRQSYTEDKTMPDDGTIDGGATPDQLVGELRMALKSKGVDIGEQATREEIMRAAIASIEGGSASDVKPDAKPDGASTAAMPADAAVANSVRSKLGLAADAGSDQIELAMSRLIDAKGSETELISLRQQVGDMAGREKDRSASALVETYVSANKLNPDSKDQMTQALSFARRDPTEFAKWMDSQTPYAPPGKTAAPPYTGSTTADKEKEMIANSVKAHNDSHKNGLIALQKKLIDESCEVNGFSRTHAVEVLTPQYPKVFGEEACV